jgi:D-apionolactonase
VSQSVSLSLGGSIPAPSGRPDRVTIDVGHAMHALPLMGTQATDLPWTDAEVAAVADAGLDHLMLTVDTTRGDAAESLRAGYDAALATDTRLRVRLVDADEDAYRSLGRVVEEVKDRVDSWMVLRSDEKVTSRREVDRARAVLGEDLPWCIGSDHYFTEINRQPPATHSLSWMAFSLNPQVHADDDRSVMQNTASHADIARDAALIAGQARVHVGPVSLRPRFNPNATHPESDVSSTALPSSVDQRQRTWISAAWTALSLRSLATAGHVGAVTYFEALGWRGLRERDAGSPDNENFPSAPGEEFPVYSFLSSLRDAVGVVATQSDQPEVADALVIRTASGHLRAFIVNLDPWPREVSLTGGADLMFSAPAQSITTIDAIRSHT